MNLDPAMMSIVFYMLTTSATAAIYVGKLATRVAVLEAGHDQVGDDLKEIKSDLKILLEAMYTGKAGTRALKKP